jgi:hypothetical protein
MADTPLVITVRRSNRAQEFAPDITREGQLPGGTERSDDAGNVYMVQRQTQEAQDLDRWMKSQIGGAPPGSSPGDQGSVESGASPTPPAAGEVPPAAGGPSLDGRDNLPPDLSASNPAVTPGEAVRAVGRNVVTAPRAVVAGATAAVGEFQKAAASLGGWLSEKIGWPVDLDEYRRLLKSEGKETDAASTDAALLKQIEAKGAEQLVLQGPKTPETATGPIVKDVAQFLTAMAIGGKILKVGGVAAGGAKKALAAGAIGDALGFDPKRRTSPRC